jgi:hypothetical protein
VYASSIRYAKTSRSRRSSQLVTVSRNIWEVEMSITCGSLHHTRDLALHTRSTETWDTTRFFSPPNMLRRYLRRPSRRSLPDEALRQRLKLSKHPSYSGSLVETTVTKRLPATVWLGSLRWLKCCVASSRFPCLVA